MAEEILQPVWIEAIMNRCVYQDLQVFKLVHSKYLHEVFKLKTLKMGTVKAQFETFQVRQSESPLQNVEVLIGNREINRPKVKSLQVIRCFQEARNRK